VNVDDVRVLDMRGQPGFVEQHVDRATIIFAVGVDSFDDHQLLKTRGATLTSEDDLRGATPADRREQLVFSQLRAGDKFRDRGRTAHGPRVGIPACTV
jgi:hypothetical protein